MNKYVKTFGITAALAVMVPLSAFAATSPTSSTAGAAASAQVQADGSTKQADGMHGRGGFGGKFISDSVLTLLNLDRETLNKKLAAGSTLAEIATEQGVASDDLKAVLTSAFEERQTNDKSQFSANLDNLINNEQLSEGREGRRGRGFGHTLDAAATALNMTEDELKTELQAGKTIADLAEEKGISEDTVTAALETAINAEIDQAVTDGKLTANEAATKKEETAAQAQSIVNGEFNLKGDGSHHGGGMKQKAQTETDDTTAAETNA
ncbi:hypothetical protein PALU110988_00970 [Paenibacillus lupini]|uniref:hypothetical protein n=1 Tax=Paenibacillus lupini TaxID=1450204 RepID=UPI001422CCAD|nr:hypothetical protein [Paenibacillus lupini]NIK23743.1 lambda repressor-like predicted transcriptional regulator [Paenibacillus lupini]